MDAVSLFDHLVVSIRDGRFNNDEVVEILQELYAAYPEAFERANLSGVFPPDWKDYDEQLPDRDTTGERPY